jgi:hypothetical protein
MTRRRRRIGWLVVSGLVVLGLVGAYFIVDSVLRTYAQNRVRQEIQAGLPEGVAGDIAVSIGGQSVIWQFFSGSFDRIELTAPRLKVAGAEAAVHLVATDVPLNTSKALGDVRGTIEMDKESINTLVAQAGVPIGSAVDLGDGRVSYTGDVTVFGMPLGYRATARPDVRGGSIILRPTDAEITTGIGAFNLTGVVERVLGDKPVTICVSRYLPAGIDLTGVTVTPDRVRLSLHASALKLDEASLSTTGSCPSS